MGDRAACEARGAVEDRGGTMGLGVGGRAREKRPARLRESEARWRAVLARDAESDGRFVYAVRSTRVFCRPSCPSRRPRPEQVRFFPSAEAARRAGFRPCKRCAPESAGMPDRARDLVVRACREIERADERPSLVALARAVGASPTHLHRSFRRLLSVTPREYADQLRLERLKQRLRDGEDIATASYAAGYGSSSRLYEAAGRRLGMTPARYRARGRGLVVRYAIVRCALGRLLVAGTERGLCRVALADTEGELRAHLREELPRAELRRDAAALAPWIEALRAYLSGRRRWPRLPLDVEATAFQRAVWDALAQIPAGTTRSYAQLARELGRPRATRAVARACATNPVAIAVPCHRAVRGDGQLAGYRWGLSRKHALLALETSAPARSERAGSAPRAETKRTQHRGAAPRAHR